MLVYHGTVSEFNAPELKITTHRLDFGPGFYVTTDFRQAEDWAWQKCESQYGTPRVYVYDFEPEGLLMKDFGMSGSIEWMDFVLKHKLGLAKHEFDAVKGLCITGRANRYLAQLIEVLNDSLQQQHVATALDIFNRTNAKKLIQIALCSEKALSHLKLIECRTKLHKNFAALSEEELPTLDELAETITTNLAEKLSKVMHYPYDVALSIITQTKFYEDLRNYKTGIWDRGPVSNWNTLQHELVTGQYEFPG